MEVQKEQIRILAFGLLNILEGCSEKELDYIVKELTIISDNIVNGEVAYMKTIDE